MDKQAHQSAKKEKKTFLQRKNLLAALGGLCFSLPFLCDYLIIFSILGAGLLFYSLLGTQKKNSFDKPFRRTFIFAMCFYVPLYYWFIALYPFDTFGFTMAQGFAVVAIACIGISLYHSLFLASIIALLSLFRLDRRLLAIAFGFAFMLDEYVISLGPLGFSWGKVAISQSGFLPAVESASLFGTYFIALVVVASGAYLALALIAPKEKKKLFAITATAIYLGNIVLGTVLYFIPAERGEVLNVAVIQGNILSNEKWKDEDAKNGTRYLSMTAEAAQTGEYDLIVLPESCFPFVFRASASVSSSLSSIAKENNLTIALGAILSVDGKSYNGCLSVGPSGEYSSAYYKRHLVPFGEYIPYEEFFSKISFVESLNLGGYSFTPGDSARLITLENGIKAGALVCFDSIFSELSRDSVQNGAEILIVVTNDSWYEDTRGVYQHAAFSKLRAIESGRCVVRAANTGISMLIDSKGKVLSSLPPLERGYTSAEVYTSDSRTLFSYIGDSVLLVLLILVLLLQIIFVIKKRGISNEMRNNSSL